MKQIEIWGETLDLNAPPYNDDYENGVINACLSPVYRDVLVYAIKKLKPEYFHNDVYADCFRAICDMIQGKGAYGVKYGEPDLMTFTEYVNTNADNYGTFRLENAKGDGMLTAFVARLLDNSLSYANTETAVNLIVKMYVARERIRIFKEQIQLTGETFDDPGKRQKALERLAELETLCKEGYDDYFTPSTLAATSSALKSQGGGLKTDYWLQKSQHGQHIKQEFKIPPKQITVIAAATGHGKSTFCYNLALRLIKHNTRPDGSPLKVVYLSYEESTENIEPKIINVMAGVTMAENNRVAIADDLAKGGKGEFLKDSPKLRGIYTAAVKEYYDMATAGTLTVKYCDLDASDLCGLIRELRRRDKADVVIIDYVQLQEKETSKSHGRNRPDELKEICADLRRVATDEKFGLPVIVASQFNREVQKSNDPRTMDKTNIGESANIEHVANVILGLWNCEETKPENYLDKDGNPTADGKRLLEFQHTANIDDPFIYARVLKSRDGVNGLNTALNYYGNCGRIDNTTDETPNQRAGGVRDENTEPHNTLTPAIQSEPAPAAEEPATASGETETRKWKSGKDALPF